MREIKPESEKQGGAACKYNKQKYEAFKLTLEEKKKKKKRYSKVLLPFLN